VDVEPFGEQSEERSRRGCLRRRDGFKSFDEKLLRLLDASRTEQVPQALCEFFEFALIHGSSPSSGSFGA
jgi:hypothetical protein